MCSIERLWQSAFNLSVLIHQLWLRNPNAWSKLVGSWRNQTHSNDFAKKQSRSRVSRHHQHSGQDFSQCQMSLHYSVVYLADHDDLLCVAINWLSHMGVTWDFHTGHFHVGYFHIRNSHIMEFHMESSTLGQWFPMVPNGCVKFTRQIELELQTLLRNVNNFSRFGVF